MKSLIKFTAPKNYTNKGEVNFVNPDLILRVLYADQAVVIELSNGVHVHSNDTIENVVKLINDNAGH